MAVMSDATLEQRFTDVKGRIADAASRSGRSAEQVYLVAVTKYAEPDQIKTLIDLGHQDFGENKVQQLVQRAAIIDEYVQRRSLLQNTRAAQGQQQPPAGARWHMIGHLQRNKARKAGELCRLIHSVDSLRLAEELQQIGLKKDLDIEVLVQINASEEEQKFGCPLPAAAPLCEQIDSMVNVHVRGIMTMAENTRDEAHTRATFARTRELFEEIRLSGAGEGRFNILSMGMSGDYEIAIEEGANLVRVGSAIFGSPQPSAE